MNWTEVGIVSAILASAVAVTAAFVRVEVRTNTLKEQAGDALDACASCRNLMIAHHNDTRVHRDPERDEARWKDLIGQIGSYQDTITKRMDRFEDILINAAKGNGG